MLMGRRWHSSMWFFLFPIAVFPQLFWQAGGQSVCLYGARQELGRGPAIGASLRNIQGPQLGPGLQLSPLHLGGERMPNVNYSPLSVFQDGGLVLVDIRSQDSWVSKACFKPRGFNSLEFFVWLVSDVPRQLVRGG